MSKKVQKSLVMLLAVMLFLSFGTIFPVHAVVTPKIFVDPPQRVYYTYEKTKCNTFTVDVKVANVTGLGGVEFELYWDPTLLSGVSMQEVLFTQNTPPGEEDNIWKIKHIVYSDHVWYAYTYMDMDRAIAGGYAPINITEAYPPSVRTVATITLHIEKIPPKDSFVDCVLELKVHKLGDVTGKAISHEAVNGYYKLIWAPPVIMPYLSVEPPTYTARALGEEFEIDIMINNLAEGWELVGLEFKLGYNTTILEVVGGTLGVKNGTFFEPFGAAPNGGVFYFKIVEYDYVLVGVMVLPDATGVWHTPFPSGSGVVATIRFKAIAQGLFPQTYSCVLDLYGIKGGDTKATPIPFGPEVDGYYKIMPKVIGRAIDVYTQYPFPFGGQGINETSDMFWPQKKIYLFANVTYNEWPEQNKVVTFEVRAPDDEIIAILSDDTDEKGVAWVSFIIPWPEGKQWLCGVFTVVASVDIACVVVKDWLWFHFDYLTRWVSVTTDKTEYKHCEEILINVTFKSKAMQTYPVVITLVLKDELQFTFGMIVVNGLKVGGAEYCEYKEYEVTQIILHVHVHKHVRAGIATIHVNSLSALPWDCGSAWCPEYVDPMTGLPPEITILAEWA